MSCTHRHEIEALLAGELGPAQVREARSHVAVCAVCRDLYDVLAPAISAFEGGTIPQSAVDAIAADVLPAQTRSPRSAGRWVPYVIGLAAAAMLAVGVLADRRATAELVTAELVAAGPERLARGGAEAPLSFGVYCLDVADGKATVRASAVAGQSLRCDRSGRLSFDHGGDAPYRFIAVFSVVDSTVRWYHRDVHSARIQWGAGHQQLPGSVRLAGTHPPGRYAVYALFSADEVDRERVERVVSEGSALSGLGDVVQVELWVD